MAHTISSKMAVLSHLSDAQELLNFGQIKDAYKRINLAKSILIKYPNDTEVTEDELNKIWQQVCERS